MTLDDALQELHAFVEANRQFFPELALEIPRPLDMKVFPDEWDAVQPPESGMYILCSNGTSEVLYVGISNYIVNRVNQHIGPGYTWARGGRQCNFPEVALDRPWLRPETRSLLRRGDFRLQPIGVTPFECSALLEAFLIARAFVKEGRRPEINVEF